MKKMIYAVMAIASLTYSTHTTAQSQDLQKKVNDYFEQSLQAQQKALEQDGKADYAKNTPLDTELQTAIKNKDIANYQKMVWTAWCEANNALQEEKLLTDELDDVTARLHRIEKAYESDEFTEEEHIRIGFAIDRHKKNIERLKVLIQRAKADHATLKFRKN